jgi:hypothetical protein
MGDGTETPSEATNPLVQEIISGFWLPSVNIRAIVVTFINGHLADCSDRGSAWRIPTPTLS